MSTISAKRLLFRRHRATGSNIFTPNERFEHVRRDLERAQTSRVIVDLRCRDNLVGGSFLEQHFQPFVALSRGVPTAVQRVRSSTAAFSPTLQRPSMLSTGGGSFPGRPRTILRNCSWAEVKRRSASASVSAAKIPTPIMACGCASAADGLKCRR